MRLYKRGIIAFKMIFWAFVTLAIILIVYTLMTGQASFIGELIRNMFRWG